MSVIAVILKDWKQERIQINLNTQLLASFVIFFDNIAGICGKAL